MSSVCLIQALQRVSGAFSCNSHQCLSLTVRRDTQALDHTPWQCLQSADFWLLWIANGIASGAGLTLLNNLGQQVGKRAPLSPRLGCF
jgi:hypothetical protein